MTQLRVSKDLVSIKGICKKIVLPSVPIRSGDAMDSMSELRLFRTSKLSFVSGRS